jgi:hypothetical protein
LAFRSTLPPRPEHMRKVLDSLSDDAEQSESGLVISTGLTLTQVRSAVEGLVGDGKVAVTKHDEVPRTRVALVIGAK